jgi:hypothetical protein
MRSIRARFLGLLLLLTLGTAAVVAQPAASTIRLAFLRQWVVNQHRVPLFGFQRHLAPEFGSALESGVVDRTVFAWQRGRIQRWWLLRKPVRVLSGDEAAALGGRGQFDLVAVRPPRGPAAWTEVEVVARTAQAEDALILEVGGEVDVINQVLETFAVIPPGGGPLREVSLVRLVAPPRPADGGDAIPVVVAPTFGEPLEAARATPFGRADGVEFLVVRSAIPVIGDGAMTNNGTADLATETAGEWRQGDRLLVRVLLASLRSGAPSIALGWKDRVTKPESEGGGNGKENRPPR